MRGNTHPRASKWELNPSFVMAEAPTHEEGLLCDTIAAVVQAEIGL